MLTQQDLMDQRELIQDDLSCVLDRIGVDSDTLTKVHQVVVDRFLILENKLKEND